MAHRHIEDLILADRPLNTAEEAELQSHLAVCEACGRLHSGWTRVSVRLSQIEMRPPAPGFVERWQTHLDRHRLRQERRNNWLVLAAVSLGALVLSSLLLGNWISSFDSLAGVLLAAAEQMTVVFSLFNVAAELFLTLARSFPVIVVISLWAALGTLFLMGTLWIVSLQQFAFRRRILT